MGRFIEDGDLDTLLTQPKSVLVHALGLRSQPSGFGDLISGVVFIAWSGQVSWRATAIAAVVIVASALILVACGVVFFSLAFWTWLWGPVGTFLSVPFLIIAMVTRNHLFAEDEGELPE